MTPVDLPEAHCLEFVTTCLFHLKKGTLNQLPKGKKAAIYGVSVRNVSDEPVRIIGRKWVTKSSDGEITVTEGDKLFGSRPLLLPGQIFAVNGFHIVQPPSSITLTLIGRSNDGNIFRTPSYKLKKG